MGKEPKRPDLTSKTHAGWEFNRPRPIEPPTEESVDKRPETEEEKILRLAREYNDPNYEPVLFTDPPRGYLHWLLDDDDAHPIIKRRLEELEEN